MSILITQQTDAAVSATLTIGTDYNAVSANNRLSASFRVIGGTLASDEYVKLQYYDGSEWRDANVDGNDGKILDIDNSVKSIYGRMPNIRISKSATSVAIGVEVV